MACFIFVSYHIQICFTVFISKKIIHTSARQSYIIIDCFSLLIYFFRSNSTYAFIPIKEKRVTTTCCSAYRQDNIPLFADLHIILTAFTEQQFVITNKGYSIGVIDTSLLPVPPTPSNSPIPLSDCADVIHVSVASPPMVVESNEPVSHNVLSLNPRDMQVTTFPSVHRPSFSFGPEFILACIDSSVQRRYIEAGIDLYVQYAKAQRGLMPMLKISLFIVGAEGWRAYQVPEKKASMITIVSRNFDSPNRKTQLTLASNLLKRSIRYFSVITSVGTDHLFDRSLSINGIVNLKKAVINDFP